ncbi:MAG: FkbM family methyltransferase [Rhodobacterales bacterium]|nr:FkbM family methyltransferase [Rhodobacterales bacterium]
MVPDTGRATWFLLRTLKLQRPTRVVDVGASPVNTPPYKALLQMGGCDVIGFEPQAAEFEKLQQARSGRETYFPFAVGDGSTRELKIFQRSDMTSVHEPYLPAGALLGRRRMLRVAERVAMQTVALDSVGDIDSFDLLKIDIQGGEVDAFRGAAGKLAQALVVIVELRHLQLYVGEPMAAGIDTELRKHGFELHRFLHNTSLPIRNSQRDRLLPEFTRDQLVDGDAVYVRGLTAMEKLGDDDLRHLAILGSGVFFSHTLVLACLDELARRGGIEGDLAARYVDHLPPRMRTDGDPPGRGPLVLT